MKLYVIHYIDCLHNIRYELVSGNNPQEAVNSFKEFAKDRIGTIVSVFEEVEGWEE